MSRAGRRHVHPPLEHSLELKLVWGELRRRAELVDGPPPSCVQPMSSCPKPLYVFLSTLIAMVIIKLAP